MQVLNGKSGAVTGVVISPDSRYVLGSQLWDLDNPQAPIVDPRASLPFCGWQFISPTQLFGQEGSPLRWWRFDIVTEKLQELDPRSGELSRTVAVHPSGETLVSSISTYGSAQGVEPEKPLGLITFRFTADGLEITGTPEYENYGDYLRKYGRNMSIAASSPQGDRIVLRHNGNSYGLYDPIKNEYLREFKCPDDRYRGLPPTFSPDGQLLYVQHRWGIECFQCAGGGPAVATLGKLKRCDRRTMAAHPAGRVIASTDATTAVTFRDARTLETLRTYDFKMGVAHSVAFTPDGTRCVVGYARGKVLLFDVE